MSGGREIIAKLPGEWEREAEIKGEERKQEREGEAKEEGRSSPVP